MYPDIGKFIACSGVFRLVKEEYLTGWMVSTWSHVVFLTTIYSRQDVCCVYTHIYIYVWNTSLQWKRCPEGLALVLRLILELFRTCLILSLLRRSVFQYWMKYALDFTWMKQATGWSVHPTYKAVERSLHQLNMPGPTGREIACWRIWRYFSITMIQWYM